MTLSGFLKAKNYFVHAGSTDCHRGASFAHLRVRATPQPVWGQHQAGGKMGIQHMLFISCSHLC